jgi:enoyl-CoA hydratase
MIRRERLDNIEIVRLEHGKANVLDLELANGIDEVFRELEMSDVGAVVLTGRGSIFSAGVDLFRLIEGGASYVEEFLPALERMLRRVFLFPRPLVTAVNGHAIAGGCLLAVCGDFRIMADARGRIGVPELLVGVPFPPFALEMLRFSVSPVVLQRMVYGGETVEPVLAKEGGVVDEVVLPDDLETVALSDARRLAELDREVFAVTKAQLREWVAEAAAPWEAAGNVANLWSSKAARDRIRLYLDRTIRK